MNTNPFHLRARIVQVGHEVQLAKRIVVTGGTHSGKSTLVRQMSKRGWETIDEAALFVINKHVAALGNEGFKSWMDANYSSFQNQIFARQRELERRYKPLSGVLFMDRSGVDSIAYLRSRNLPPPDAMLAYAKQSAFSHVFLFDTLHSFAATYADSIAMRDCLLDTYRSYGYEPIRVPELPLLQRCDFVLQQIRCWADESA
jgi:predicted ATPase